MEGVNNFFVEKRDWIREVPSTESDDKYASDTKRKFLTVESLVSMASSVGDGRVSHKTKGVDKPRKHHFEHDSIIGFVNEPSKQTATLSLALMSNTKTRLP